MEILKVLKFHLSSSQYLFINYKRQDFRKDTFIVRTKQSFWASSNEAIWYNLCASLLNRYIIAWMLRQIFIFSNKMKLAAG